MVHDIVSISVKDTDAKAKLYTYFLDNSSEIDPKRVRPVILICPGGGYKMTSDREAEALAIQFLAAGFHAAVLRYSVYPYLYPTALRQLAASVAYLREHAQEFHIDTDWIIIQGSSAGGHLAASYGVFWKKKSFLARELGVASELLRPNGLMLSYPVITAGPHANKGSLEHLLGEEKKDLRSEMSLEFQVDADTPPAFLWHTITDDCVPVENSLLFVQALHEQGIEAELHIYPCGGHGLSLATEETENPYGFGVQKECQSWMKLAVDWVKGRMDRADQKR